MHIIHLENENYVILSYGELTLAVNASNGIILDQIQQLSKGLAHNNCHH